VKLSHLTTLLTTLLPLMAAGCSVYDADILNGQRGSARAQAVESTSGSGASGAPAADGGGGVPAADGGRVGAPEAGATGGRPAPTPNLNDPAAISGKNALTGAYTGAGLPAADSCGDGLLEPDERCDTAIPVGMPGTCPSDCPSNGSCSMGALIGTRCNSTCGVVEITVHRDGDGCCPSGADANDDDDCQPRCGNGVQEQGEACDGSSGCDSNCQIADAGPTDRCQMLVSDACGSCQCAHCASELLACEASGDSARDTACRAVEACATANDCAGQGCYCGLNVVGCELAPTGPCRKQIEAAAGTTSALAIMAQYGDPASILGRAGALGTCRRSSCISDCR
jgi:hypothetical protein